MHTLGRENKDVDFYYALPITVKGIHTSPTLVLMGAPFSKPEEGQNVEEEEKQVSKDTSRSFSGKFFFNIYF